MILFVAAVVNWWISMFHRTIWLLWSSAVVLAATWSQLDPRMTSSKIIFSFAVIVALVALIASLNGYIDEGDWPQRPEDST
jgi:hypothetical protein